MKSFATRTTPITTSIFATMSKLAFEHNAVNLGQGFPDFDGPEWIMDEALKAMHSGKNQYAPMPGIFSLRQAIVGYHKKFYDLHWDADAHVTITAGATEALFSSMLALIDPGDEVILFEPYYDSYQANVLLAGGLPKYVTLRKPDFHFDAEELERSITHATTMLILNNPHNPTGKMYSREELETIAKLAVKHDLLVLSDEVYEFLGFDGNEHIPIASLPGMNERTITISSTGKTFGMTGWKIGYAIAPALLTDSVRKVHQFATFAVNTPGQHAMALALTRLESYLPEFRTLYAAKRGLLYDGLRGTIFTPHQPQGSYFMMADIPPALGQTDVECAIELVKTHGVASIPPSVFYSKSNEGASMLRFCFAKKDETLKSGIEKLRANSITN
jgi:aspartate/methionine/tyrosine aminotransferase